MLNPFVELCAAGFMPHGHCYFWQSDLLWLHVLSNALIVAAYCAIPICLFIFVRRRKDLIYRGLFFLFGCFILLCAASHAFAILTIWKPAYYSEGIVLAATGLVSAATAVALFVILPTALKIPSPEDLKKTREELAGEAEAKLRAETEKERAEAANKMKNEFLANMSHEIRTPLNGIMGMLDLMSQSPLNQEQKEDLHIAQDSSETLLALINDILDLSRIETGNLQLRPQEMSIRETIHHVVELLRPKAEAKHLEISLQVSNNLPSVVLGDRARVAQILTNLLNNAIKFTREGRIDVLVHDEAINDDTVCISMTVADTGIGIPKEMQEKIFDSFSQAHGDISLDEGGAGLGLAISSRLARQMGGRLSVESAVGQGALFTATLVFERNYHSGKENQKTGTVRNSVLFEKLKGKRILAAEDNLHSQRFMSRALENQKCEVTLCSNGEEALKAYDNDSFDAILLDIRMPEVDGLSVTRAVRKKEASQRNSSRVPIIALTAYAGDVNEQRCFDAGMDAFIVKPYSSREMLEKLAALIQSERE